MPEMAGLDEGAPLFVQIAERLAEDIADGSLAEGERVPSTNELAAFYRINPATEIAGVISWYPIMWYLPTYGWIRGSARRGHRR